MDDLIQRQAVLDALRARFGVDFDYGKWWSSTHVLAAIESVPAVKPQYTNAEIQKMQELEQAEIEKAYELGKEAAKVPKTGRWEEVQVRTIHPYNRISKARKCSACGKRKDKYVTWNYCPNCGCHMVEPPESEDKE